MFRPITLWPFPSRALRDTARHVKDFLVFEMSTGQMVEDVRLALEGRGNVHFYGRPGGELMTVEEVLAAARTAFAAPLRAVS